ncbi:DUF4492 domain-containing protein [Desulfobacterota bacterium M19]
MKSQNHLKNIFSFYLDGFRRMTVGKSLWKIIIIKVLIIFGVIKVFFFPDFLHTTFHNDRQRAAYVLSEMSRPANVKIKTLNLEADR